MKVLSTTLADSMQMLGQSFLLAFYLPALLFLLLHAYVLLPIWHPTQAEPTEDTSSAALEKCKTDLGTGTNEPKDLLATALKTWLCAKIADQADESPATWFEGLSDEVTFLLAAFFVGLILLRLNGYLIQGFEGKYRVLKEYLLYPLTERNRKQSKALYGELIKRRKKYDEYMKLYYNSKSDQEKLEYGQTLVSLSGSIRELHNKIEDRTPVQILPYESKRICPTRFGNYYALAEEYSDLRYRADAVLFWTRLSELMQDEAPEHSQRLMQQKTTLDFTLNLTFLCVLLVIEGCSTLLGLYFYDQPVNWWVHWPLFALVGIAIPLTVLLYYSSVGAVYVLGELIKNSFDDYRHLILTSFGLKLPDTLREEQIIWIRLAAFIRRGDEFYFPTEFKAEKEHDIVSKRVLEVMKKFGIIE